MKKVTFSEIKPYKAPLHFDCSTLKMHGLQETGIENFWMGLSHFLPAGGAEYAYEDSPTEKVYVVLEGEVTVKSKTETIILKKWDSVFIAPFEGREIVNETNMPATMLVVVNNV
ncbi:cupin domain-containing protein [Alkalibaculum sp. M08DMB]|uniref:Cupin domain-containing protein n=1 Tax=Alkalibaculum sporogenes TaxID=2655001 RepID=A0A6A7K6C9_9FIRM|nr:cupin domain-containing protein [Alkalibaculum sporogenes]MPW24713.1 cupin domain-containing protein [Alkalibaculum sporogenes]